ncbi:hypothetical protein ACEUCB_21170 [Aeromonas veronii]
MFTGEQSARIREILISEPAWEEMTCLFALSLRYEVRLLLYRRDYTKKIKYLDQIIDTTSCPKTKADLERQKNTLLIAAAKAISEEKV